MTAASISLLSLNALLAMPTAQSAAPTPLSLVVMGVSGSGKTSFSQAIAQALHLTMLDGDDLHAPQSIAKMKAGIALNDEDRWPWLDRVAGFLKSGQTNGGPEAGQSAGRVIACSALKLAYRDRIRQELPGVTFIFMDGTSELIRSRMALRIGHFMRLELLEDQLRTLQRPTAAEADVITLETARPMGQLVDQVAIALQQRQWSPD